MIVSSQGLCFCHFQNEVVLHRFERTIHNVPFFRNCPEDATVTHLVSHCPLLLHCHSLHRTPVLMEGSRRRHRRTERKLDAPDRLLARQSDICLRLRGHTSAPDDTIMTRGEHSSELIIMERGEATGADGSITIKLDAGSFFGELQVLRTRKLHSALALHLPTSLCSGGHDSHWRTRYDCSFSG